MEDQEEAASAVAEDHAEADLAEVDSDTDHAAHTAHTARGDLVGTDPISSAVGITVPITTAVD